MKDYLDEFFESMSPLGNSILAIFMGVFAHLDTITTVIALLVVLLQLRAVVYKGMREKLAYELEKSNPKKEKECQQN